MPSGTLARARQDRRKVFFFLGGAAVRADLGAERHSPSTRLLEVESTRLLVPLQGTRLPEVKKHKVACFPDPAHGCLRSKAQGCLFSKPGTRLLGTRLLEVKCCWFSSHGTRLLEIKSTKVAQERGLNTERRRLETNMSERTLAPSGARTKASEFSFSPPFF